MRNITRSNYTPKIGDYHNMIVHDPVKNKIWLFDCDGVFLDMTKTNIIVVDGPGDSADYAISQRYVTESLNNLNANLIEFDENAQIRDGQILAELDEEVERIDLDIARVNTEAIERETNIQTALTNSINLLRNDIETLTRIVDNNTNAINTINNTAVFGVVLDQSDGASVILKVTDGGQTTNTVVREASATQNGLMSASTFSQVQQNSDAIQHLQNAGLYRGSFDTLNDAPTSTPDAAFVGGEAFNNDYIAVQHATYQGETGVGRYRITVNNGAVTYAFEAFIDRDILNFTTGNPGLIVGGTNSGEVEAQSNGTGKVIGWDTLAADVAQNTSDISDANSDISALQTRATTIEGNVSGLTTRMSTAEGNITTNANNISANTSAISTANSNITALQNKGVQAATDTTLGTNTENLLTVNGMMRQFVDITNTGLPANPDPNTFYYVVQS